MKTKLVQDLINAPVKFTGKRIAGRYPLVTHEESTIQDRGYSEIEQYRFEARIGAQFLREARVPEAHRELLYQQMLHSVTEFVYQEVRVEAHKMFPLIMDVGQSGDMETYQGLLDIANGILEMTKP